MTTNREPQGFVTVAWRLVRVPKEEATTCVHHPNRRQTHLEIADGRSARLCRQCAEAVLAFG